MAASSRVEEVARAGFGGDGRQRRASPVVALLPACAESRAVGAAGRIAGAAACSPDDTDGSRDGGGARRPGCGRRPAGAEHGPGPGCGARYSRRPRGAGCDPVLSADRHRALWSWPMLAGKEREALAELAPVLDYVAQRGARPAARRAPPAAALARGLQPELVRRILDDFERRASPAGVVTATGETLTREVEALRLIARGATNRAVAEALVVTERTVKGHVTNILPSSGHAHRGRGAGARESGSTETRDGTHRAGFDTFVSVSRPWRGAILAASPQGGSHRCPVHHHSPRCRRPLSTAPTTTLVPRHQPGQRRRLHVHRGHRRVPLGPPLHMHAEQDEVIHVLEGRLKVQYSTEVVRCSTPATPSSSRAVPRTVSRTWTRRRRRAWWASHRRVASTNS